MRSFYATRLAAVVAAAVVMLSAGGGAAETLRERGGYLVNTIAGCGNCHTPKDAAGRAIAAQELAGGTAFDVPGLGHIIVPNITPDTATGIGKWTEAQDLTALRDGKRPDGTLIGPPMPFEFYRRISDRDAAAIVAYIRSVRPVHHAVARTVYQVPLPPAYGPPVGHVEAPPATDKVAYGGYLAGPVGHCMDCHTPHTPDGRLIIDRLGAGGFVLPVFGGAPGASVVSRNITPDPATGIGKWSDAELKHAITSGIRPDGTKLARTMPFDWYARMTPADLDAIVLYLRSLPPVK